MTETLIISKDELKQVLMEIISAEIFPQIPQVTKTETKTDEILSRKDAAQILGVSLPTLTKYSLDGMVPFYRLGSRIRYKRNEIENCLLKIKTKY